MPNSSSGHHARQVSVSRVKKAEKPDDKAARKVIAVRRREDKEHIARPAAKILPKKEPVGITKPEAEPENKKPSVQESIPTEEVKVSAPEKAEQPVEAEAEKENELPERVTDTEAAEEPEVKEEMPTEEEQATESEGSEQSEKPEDEPVKAVPPEAESVLEVKTKEEAPEPKESAETLMTPDEEETSEQWSLRPVMDAIGGFLKKIRIPEKLIPQKWNEISIKRKLVMAASVVLLLFSCLPMAVGILSFGIVPPACIALFFFGCALYWPLIEKCESVWGNVVIAVVAVCVLAGISYLSFVSGKMISASANTLRSDTSEVTVVVLGCRVRGDKPSLMLTARLDKAAEFLLEHPQAHCIVTGGQGPDEDYPEALIMKNYLVDKGVSSMRIIMENKSTSTLENITFASELAEKYRCHDRFLIVTDRFHQYRAMTIANDLDMVTYALNVETAWYLAMPYWFREMAAITRDWVLG